VKIRIGVGVGAATSGASDFDSLVDACESLGFDSLWLSERIGAPSFDPIAALSYAAGRTQRIKLGSSVSVLPGRNPAEVAKSWASLDVLSGGRALPAFGLGVVHPNEQQAFGVERNERASRFEEMLPLVRRLWHEAEVTHHGRYFQYEAVHVEPKPTKPLDVWMGGAAPAELRRCGRLADGWLASFTTPTDAAAGRAVIETAAAEAGRTVDPEHFGAMVMYCDGELPSATRTALSARRPGREPTEVIATDRSELRRRCEEYVAVGFSKLVVVPLTPADWESELTRTAQAVLPLTT
jgi:probable F420-dependent oxidoreductase